MLNSIGIKGSQKHHFNSDEICYLIESAVNETKKDTCIHVFLTFMNVVQHSTSMMSVRIIAVSELYSMIERPCRTQLPAKPNSKL